MDSLLDYDKEYLQPPWGKYGRDLTLGLVSLASKFFLQLLNTTKVLNHERYLDLVYSRSSGVGLLTISNHTSTFDDPGLPCAMLPATFYFTEHQHGKTRWTMCASDICFTNELFRQFFMNGKTLPVDRGSGVEQQSMAIAARTLAAGDWLHIFPEGRITPDGTVGPFRQGIGRLVCDARAAAGGRDPIILPYFHSNMGRVMPFKASVPRAGHTVTVAVGEPIQLDHITCRCNQPGEDQQQVWRDIAAALRDAVLQLEGQVPPNPNQVAERPDVAEWERRYQERQRQRRLQQQPEAVLRKQHVDVTSAAVEAPEGMQQGIRAALSGKAVMQMHQQEPQQHSDLEQQSEHAEEGEQQLVPTIVGAGEVVQQVSKKQHEPQQASGGWWRFWTAGWSEQQHHHRYQQQQEQQQYQQKQTRGR